MQNTARMTRLSGMLGGLLLAMMVVGSVAAYQGEVAATVEGSGPAGPQPCNTPIKATMRVEDLDGKPIAGQTVTWSFASGNIAGDTILDTATLTNADGVATTRVRLACTPHTVIVQGDADLASGTLALQSSGEGLPRTDTAGAPTSVPALALAVLAVLAVLIGSGTILHRFAADRR